MSVSYNFGKIAEDLAADYLLKNNYLILDRNWRYSRYEVDIIAQKDNFVIIIEVKARKETPQNFNAFNIEDVVSDKKQKNLINAAEKYLEEKNLDFELRFDVIMVLKYQNNTKIEHIPNAFYSMLE